jgi:hypothetical protein
MMGKAAMVAVRATEPTHQMQPVKSSCRRSMRAPIVGGPRMPKHTARTSMKSLASYLLERIGNLRLVCGCDVAQSNLLTGQQH